MNRAKIIAIYSLLKIGEKEPALKIFEHPPERSRTLSGRKLKNKGEKKKGILVIKITDKTILSGKKKKQNDAY